MPSRFLAAVLIAIASVTSGHSAPSPSPTLPELASGFYGILADETDRARLPAPGANTTIVTYDSRVSDAASQDPKRYLLVPARPDVPLILGTDPKKEKSPRGSLLSLQLDPKHTKLLEEFTRKNVMKMKVATIIEGQVLSVNKIREPIVGGRIQVSWCSHNACEVIYLKLLEKKR